MNFRKSFARVTVFAAAIGGLFAFRAAHAVVPPTATPGFSNSLNITSTFAPFQPGGVKIFQGSDGHKKEVVLHNYRVETRDFSVNGTSVSTHVLREMNFNNGLLAQLTDNFLAQGDDGNVYSFGKMIINFTNGVGLNTTGSWLVGGPTTNDPQDTATATAPSVFMLGVPEVGDVFTSENVPPQLEVTDQVTQTNGVVGSGLGEFTNVLTIVEREAGEPKTTLSFVPDVGLVRQKNKKESLRMISSTLNATNSIVSTNTEEVSTNGVISTNSIIVSPPNGTIVLPTNSVTVLPTNSVTDTNAITPIIPQIPTVPENPTNGVTPTEPVTPATPTNSANPNLPPTPF
jgi:hypothetical protein